MLLKIGARSTESDVVDLLLECHTRIRNFLAMARRLALSSEAPAAERREVASQIHRYFTSAFPLHMADEDELLAKLLEGRAPTAALSTMSSDHVQHAPTIARLVEACAAIMQDPRASTEHDAELLAAVKHATLEIEPHLELEERDIFPVLRQMPRSVTDAIRAGMRDRRDAVLRPR